jgi:hypothetical protein
MVELHEIDASHLSNWNYKVFSHTPILELYPRPLSHYSKALSYSILVHPSLFLLK